MSKTWVTGLALFLLVAAGCNISATAITSRGVNAVEETEQDAPPFQSRTEIYQAEVDDNDSPDLSMSSDHILTAVVVPYAEKKADPKGDSLSVQGVEPALTSNEMGSAAERYETMPTLAESDGSISQSPDVPLTVKPTQTPTPTLVPALHVDESTIEKAPQSGPTLEGDDDVSTPDPEQNCIHSGGLTLWLESQGGAFVAQVGKIVEVNLCLSNLRADLAWFDLVLNLERTGTAEFIEISMGGFSLESYSELPSESVRVRAIDFNQKLNAGADGILLATLRIAGTGVGDSPLTIEIKGIHDKDGNSASVEVLQASLKVIEE